MTLDYFLPISSSLLEGMVSNKKIHIKVIENVTDEELHRLIYGLKKIQGFNFSINNIITVSSNKIENQSYVFKNPCNDDFVDISDILPTEFSH